MMPSLRLCVFGGAVAALMALTGSTAWPDLPDLRSPESIFEGIRQSRGFPSRMAFDATSVDFISDAPDALPDKPTQRSDYQVRISGDRYDVVVTTYLDRHEGELSPNVHARSFWDGTRNWNRSKLVGGELHAVVMEQEDSHNRLMHNQDVGYFMEGRFLHNFHGDWVELLENDPGVTLRDSTERVDGHECYVLDAVTSHGTYSLWVDPEYGYGIRRGTIVVNSDDEAWDTKLRDTEYHAPGRQIARIEMTIDEVAITEYDGHYVATEGSLDKKYFYDDGTMGRVKTFVTRTNIDLAPDFDAMGAFEVDYPDGVDVQYWFEGGTRLSYVWRNGQLAPRVDEKTLRSIEETVDSLAVLTQETGTAPSLSAGRATLVTPALPAAQSLSRSPRVGIGCAVVGGAAVILGLYWSLRIRKRTPGHARQ